MGKNFFNLPSPWNPGFALPANVEAEGLRRATLVTGWLPRGHYEASEPARSRYAVPSFIAPEVAGAARVTGWLPRGTYTGGRLAAGVAPSRVGSPITKYGEKAAAHLVATVQKLPAHQRGPALKLVLAKVDPTLWARAGQHANLLRSRGASSGAALHGGIAKAMSDGIASELAVVGRNRKAPAARSLLGLGCYGCAMALGDVIEELGATTDHRGTTSATTGTRNADGTITTAHGTTGVAAVTGDTLSFGPFLFPAAGQRIRVHSAAVLPPAWAAWFPGELKRLTAADPGLQADPANIGLASFFPAGTWKATDRVNPKYTNGSTPFFKGKNPITGKDMGAFLTLVPGAQGWVLDVYYRDVDLFREKSGWGKAWDAIKNVAAKIVHTVVKVAKEALDGLKTIACTLVNDPAAAGAAALAAGPAAAIGVGLTQGMCTPAEVAPVIDLTGGGPPGGGLLLPLAIGGGLLAFFLLRK